MTTWANGCPFLDTPAAIFLLYEVADQRVIRIGPLDEKTGEGYLVELCDRETGRFTQEFGESPASLNEAIRFALGAFYHHDDDPMDEAYVEQQVARLHRGDLEIPRPPITEG